MTVSRSTAPGDPRPDLPEAGSDIRPVVAPPPRGVPTALIAGGALAAGIALFLVLDGHRRAVEMPAVRAPRAAGATAGADDPPPLYLPPETVVAAVEPALPAPARPFVLPEPPRPPRIVYAPQPAAPAPFAMPAPVQSFPAAPVRNESGGATLVIDTTAPDGSPGGAAPATSGGGNDDPAFTALRAGNASVATASTAPPAARSRATMLGARSTSVLQGTLIPVVLETALDTTRPGLARAVVQADVRGFDGTRVLIPRGSRLTGEYRSDAAAGQNRALIVWMRLVRPDGAAIALASPAADTLGRAGVKAKVDSHFLTRFAGAILQSVLSVGVNLASRSRSNDTVVLGLPGSQFQTSGGFGFNQNNQVTPTLKVPAGTSIGVLVSRDLDFSDVEGRR